jgi:hypothetical protein
MEHDVKLLNGFVLVFRAPKQEKQISQLTICVWVITREIAAILGVPDKMLTEHWFLRGGGEQTGRPKEIQTSDKQSCLRVCIPDYLTYSTTLKMKTVSSSET